MRAEIEREREEGRERYLRQCANDMCGTSVY